MSCFGCLYSKICSSVLFTLCNTVFFQSQEFMLPLPSFFRRRCHALWKGLNCNSSDDVISFENQFFFSSGQDNSALVFLKLLFLGAIQVSICSFTNVCLTVQKVLNKSKCHDYTFLGTVIEKLTQSSKPLSWAASFCTPIAQCSI